MPSSKAYGIQIAKMCEAFIEQGVELELIIPRTRQSHLSLKEFYGLRVDVPTRVLATVDWYSSGRIGFFLSSLIFMTSACLYLLRCARASAIYTIDMDSYSYAPLVLLGLPVSVEMHSPKTANIGNRFFFKRVAHIITTNPLIKESLGNVFGLPSERFIVEPNGVDPLVFEVPSKEYARSTLNLPADAKIVLYVGRFYDWKGLSVLHQAAIELEKNNILTYAVGGTKEEFEVRTKESSPALLFGGLVVHKDIGTWCAAADVLLILGTKTNEFSYRYTAPMKLYEYLASGRPIVVADTPALRSLTNEEEAEFYIPDNADDLVQKISTVFSSPKKSKHAVAVGVQKAREHTWNKRAGRIISFMGYFVNR
ncbi:MAG: glycosyltransferase family 4 protein [Candidatus Kaiserbacteria bacterium]|nr:glycosyltransferase family 4 protein [Candidatus Kaiserbacteria bacterium]